LLHLAQQVASSNFRGAAKNHAEVAGLSICLAGETIGAQRRTWSAFCRGDATIWAGLSDELDQPFVSPARQFELGGSDERQRRTWSASSRPSP